MDAERFNKVAAEYRNRYEMILKAIWPTIESNGFNELNQTINFINAYEMLPETKKQVSGMSFKSITGVTKTKKTTELTA